MGWVVQEIVGHTRREAGVYSQHEWRKFCDHDGVQVFYRELPEGLPGILFRDVLILDPGLTDEEQARAAWHELGHRRVHVGDCRDWLSLMACGDLCVQKFERQAEEFAEAFPVGDDEGEPCTVY